MSNRSVLIVGDAPRKSAQLQLFLRQDDETEYCSRLDAASNASYDLVVAFGQIDFVHYLKFAEHMLHLRNKVKPSGTLNLIKRPRNLEDEFFCFRTDDFFRNELSSLGSADFEKAGFEDRDGWMVVAMENRRTIEEGLERLKSLPRSSLANLYRLTSRCELPKFIWMAATTRCNLRCHTCSVRSAPNGVDMLDDVRERVFAELGEHVNFINVTGIGEALFSRSWKRLYELIRSKPNRTLDMVTNAVLLKEDFVRDLMKPENPTWLCLSIDGATKETYEFIRDRAKFEYVIRAVEMIKRLREELNPGDHFKLAVSFVAVKDNVHELPELIRMMADWKVDWCIVTEMGDWELNRQFFRQQALRFHPQHANKHYALAREEAAKHPHIFVSIPPDYNEEIVAEGGIVPEFAPESISGARRFKRKLRDLAQQKPGFRSVAGTGLSLLERYMSNPVGCPSNVKLWLQRQLALANYPIGRFRRIKGYCEIVEDRAYFHAKGDVVPCCGLLGTKFGNIAEESFSDIWYSPRYVEYRIMNLLGYPDNACFYCTLSYGLPEQNPENFIARNLLPNNPNRLAHFIRSARPAVAAPPPEIQAPSRPSATAVPESV